VWTALTGKKSRLRAPPRPAAPKGAYVAQGNKKTVKNHQPAIRSRRADGLPGAKQTQTRYPIKPDIKPYF